MSTNKSKVAVIGLGILERSLHPTLLKVIVKLLSPATKLKMPRRWLCSSGVLQSLLM